MTEKSTKTETQTKTETPSKTETQSKTPVKESSSDEPGGYHRGENQKDITDSYRKNWKSIFVKKPPHNRATGRRQGHTSRKH